MQDDDKTVGMILSRQQVLRYLGAAGVSALGFGVGAANAASSPSGVLVRPESIEGPYFLDDKLDRSDIRIEPTTKKPVPGIPLSLTLNIAGMEGAQSRWLTDAYVHLWQCDSKGEYSGVEDKTVGFNTSGTSFLRGYQKTDANGQVRFVTIYPGWYQGRCVHTHVKVLTRSQGRPYEFTSQLYFDEAQTDKVHAREPYAKKGRRTLVNEQDRYYMKDGGSQMKLAVADDGQGAYKATFDIGLDLLDQKVAQSDRWLLELDPTRK